MSLHVESAGVPETKQVQTGEAGTGSIGICHTLHAISHLP